MKAKKVILFFLFISFLTLSCSEKEANNFLINQKLMGCWVGGLLKNGNFTEDIELRFLKVKPDSTLIIYLIYELGPRSRVWEYDTEISCQDHEISWLAHKGHLSENLDTMYITKNWKGEQSEWMFFRDKNYDDFIHEFISNINNEYAYSIPTNKNDNLSCTSLENVGIESVQIKDFVNGIKSGNFGDVHSVLIYRQSKLALEEYFALTGRFSGSFINETYRNKVHQLSSVTKGVLSLITGIAIEQGNIADVHEPILNHLKEYTHSFSNDEKQIQINHLLTMTSGWSWDQFNYPWTDKRNDGANLYKCEDVVEYVLERQLIAKPGERFNYTNGDPTVLGAVLKNACSMEVDKYTELHLFNPLGISEYQWSRYPDGTLKTDGGLQLTSRDLLKVGILLLNNGNWYGNQITSVNWISESTKTRKILSIRRGYGYYWNEMKFKYRGNYESAIFAPGDGGQFLVVFPSLDMVIVFTAGNYDKDSTKVYWEIITDNILPALK